MSEERQDMASKQQISTELLLEALYSDKIDDFRAEFLELHPYDQAAFFRCTEG